MATASTAISQKGRSKLALGGHLYVKGYASKDGRQTWRCMCTSAKTPCKALAYTRVSTGEVVGTSGVHSDPSDPSGVQVARISAEIKRRCVETTETPSAIISSALSSATVATLGRIPKAQTLARMINRHRNAVSQAPTNPDSRESIVLPNIDYESEPGVIESFLIADSGFGDSERIIILGRAATESWIGVVDKLYADGTFSLSPSLFSQVLIFPCLMKVWNM